MSQNKTSFVPAGYHIGLNITLNFVVGAYYLYMTINNLERGIYPNPPYDPLSLGGAIGTIFPSLLYGTIFPLIIAFIIRIFKPKLFIKTLIITMYIMQVFLLVGLYGSILINKRLYGDASHHKSIEIIHRNHDKTFTQINEYSFC